LQAYKEAYKVQRMSTLAERIKSAQTHAKLTQKALALKAGVEQPVISQLETGKNLQSAHLPKIAHACGVSAIWLSENMGPMTGAANSDSNIAEARQPVESYPVISWVAAGAGAVEPYPAGFSDRYEFSEYDSKGSAFWLEVKGDSMTSPAGQSVAEGILILVDTEAEAAPDKLVIAKLPDSNEATFKKLVKDGGRLFLKPLNPGYPIEPFDEHCRIVGVVVRALQKF
jgi:SOS-response transcriptional repressor LexA